MKMSLIVCLQHVEGAVCCIMHAVMTRKVAVQFEGVTDGLSSARCKGRSFVACVL